MTFLFANSMRVK